MKPENRLPLALFFLRLGVFLVMFMWTLDKLLRPQHAAGVFERFYYMGGLSDRVFYVIGVLELIVVVGFLLGFQKRFTYGAVLLFHGLSTLASFGKYLAPLDNLLFFAAWPMLAAAFALYYLRDHDTLWVIEKQPGSILAQGRMGSAT